MRRVPTWMSAVAVLCIAGCASRGNVELLESRLRVQEDQLYQARRELRVAKDELSVARREVDTLRTQLASKQISVPAPEQLETFSRAESLVISKLFSGGVDKDGQPGHDAFHTVITPIDAQGELAKVPGAIHLELIDLSRPAGERQLGVWDFAAEEADKHWKKTFFSSGYTFELPWKEPPNADRVTLYVRLVTPDGRNLDASQEVKIAPGIQYAQGKTPRVSQAPSSTPAAPLLTAPEAGRPSPPAELRSADAEAAPVEKSGFVRINQTEARRPVFPAPEALPDLGKQKPRGRALPPPRRGRPAPPRGTTSRPLPKSSTHRLKRRSGRTRRRQLSRRPLPKSPPRPHARGAPRRSPRRIAGPKRRVPSCADASRLPEQVPRLPDGTSIAPAALVAISITSGCLPERATCSCVRLTSSRTPTTANPHESWQFCRRFGL